MMTFQDDDVQEGDSVACGWIDSGRLYRGTELRRRLGWRETSWRKAIRSGLVVRRVGRTQFVHGGDFIDWVASQPVEPGKQTEFPFMKEGNPDAA